MSSKKKLAVVGGVLAIMLAAGVAFAAWTATGTGSGRARAITAQTVTVTASTGTADLYPGFTGGDVYFTLTNPNPYGITFTDMSPSGPIVSSDPVNCIANWVSAHEAHGLSIHVNGNETTGQLSIADVVQMSSAAPDGCQGVSFDIPLTLTGTQS